MRQIKFRAWDGEEMLKDWLKLENTGGGVFPISLTHKAEIVMQFTELFDKYNRGIYEGDIVNHQYYGICEIIWTGGWSIKHIKNGDTRNKKQRIPQCDQTFEIIGNIYENPELLK